MHSGYKLHRQVVAQGKPQLHAREDTPCSHSIRLTQPLPLFLRDAHDFRSLPYHGGEDVRPDCLGTGSLPEPTSRLLTPPDQATPHEEGEAIHRDHTHLEG